MDDKNSNSGGQTMAVKCPFYPRMGHRALRVNEQVLIFGGSGSSGEFLKTVLRFNLENLKMEPVSNAQCPSLEGFSLFTHKGSVYVWGGSLENKSSNSLWCYQGTNFVAQAQNGEIPSARAFQCSSVIGEKYLLIFGGFNETETFNDWYILNLHTFTWNRVTPSRELPKNMKFQLIWENGRGYMLSEYQVVRNGAKPNLVPKNQLYEIRMTSFSSFKLRIDTLEDFEGEMFSPRFNFKLLFLEKQLWVLGGEQLSKAKSDESASFCNEIWAFNVQTLQWRNKCINLTTKIGFQTIGYKNKIYLLGGLRSASELSPAVEIICTKTGYQFENQICNFCKNVFSLDTKNQFRKLNTSFQIEVKDNSEILTQISTNFLSKMSRSLQNPIQAIGLLIDNSLNMGASSISVSICQPKLCSNYFKESQPYLYIGDNSRSFAADQIAKILFSFRFKVQKYYRDHIDKQDIKMRNQYGLNLKMASLRLGSSCLYVTTTVEDQIFVAFFSDCQTSCPDGEPSFNCFHYSIDKTGICSNSLNRQIIRENVRHLFAEEEFLQVKTHFTKLYILDLHDISKSQSRSNRADISYSFSHGVPLSSLRDYASSLYLNPFMGREIYIEQNRVAFVNIISKFKEDERNGLIQQIDTSLELNIFSRINLYRAASPSYPINFVYIYHENRLICTISSKQKLVCGYLEIPSLIEVDFYRTKIQRWQQERKLIGYIESKEQIHKRQRKIEKYQLEGQIRKMQESDFLQF